MTTICIKQKRLAAGLTQVELAKLVGVGQSTVAQWERGLISPRFRRLKLIAEILNCTVDDLMRDE